MSARTTQIQLPSIRDIELAVAGQRELAAFVSTKRETHRIQVFDRKNRPLAIELPGSVLPLLIDVLSELAAGNPVKVVPVQAELTTQEAADLLNVSRPHLVKLLECGELRFHRAGKHRRIRFRT